MFEYFTCYNDDRDIDREQQALSQRASKPSVFALRQRRAYAAELASRREHREGEERRVEGQRRRSAAIAERRSSRRNMDEPVIGVGLSGGGIALQSR